MITSHSEGVDEVDTLHRDKLLARCPELNAVATCVQDFATMMATRRGGDLDGWLTRAEAVGLKPLSGLVRGLRILLAGWNAAHNKLIGTVKALSCIRW